MHLSKAEPYEPGFFPLEGKNHYPANHYLFIFWAGDIKESRNSKSEGNDNRMRDSMSRGDPDAPLDPLLGPVVFFTSTMVLPLEVKKPDSYNMARAYVCRTVYGDCGQKTIGTQNN